jgi:hypothetical protein
VKALTAALSAALALAGCAEPAFVAASLEARDKNDLDWTIESEPGNAAERVRDPAP